MSESHSDTSLAVVAGVKSTGSSSTVEDGLQFGDDVSLVDGSSNHLELRGHRLKFWIISVFNCMQTGSVPASLNLAGFLGLASCVRGVRGRGWIHFGTLILRGDQGVVAVPEPEHEPSLREHHRRNFAGGNNFPAKSVSAEQAKKFRFPAHWKVG